MYHWVAEYYFSVVPFKYVISNHVSKYYITSWFRTKKKCCLCKFGEEGWSTNENWCSLKDVTTLIRFLCHFEGKKKHIGGCSLYPWDSFRSYFNLSVIREATPTTAQQPGIFTSAAEVTKQKPGCKSVYLTSYCNLDK